MHTRHRSMLGVTALLLSLFASASVLGQSGSERFREPTEEFRSSHDSEAETTESEPPEDAVGQTSPPQVQFGQFEKLGDGACRGSKVLNTLQRDRGALRGCVHSRLDPEKDADLEARIELRWTVASDGEVTWAAVTDSTLSRPSIEQCLRETLEVTAFDGPRAGNCRFRYVLEVGDPGLPGVTAPRPTIRPTDDEARRQGEEKRAPAPTIEHEAVSTAGCAKSAVDRVMDEHSSEFQSCYERALENQPNPDGALTLEWKIGPDGSVQATEVARSTVVSAALEKCVALHVQTLRFEEPEDDSCTVEYRFDVSAE